MQKTKYYISVADRLMPSLGCANYQYENSKIFSKKMQTYFKRISWECNIFLQYIFSWNTTSLHVCYLAVLRDTKSQTDTETFITCNRKSEYQLWEQLLKKKNPCSSLRTGNKCIQWIHRLETKIRYTQIHVQPFQEAKLEVKLFERWWRV